MAINRYGLVCFSVWLLGAGFSPSLQGEEPATLEPVVVHGAGLPSETEEADPTLATTVIPLADYRDRSTSVAELLEQAAGVRVQRFGGLEDFATVAIRGSTAEQVQIYLDGIPLNQASGGGVNLATIPIESIEKITIYRGQAPARFATSAIGGVIAIKTRRATSKRQTEIRQRYGSLNTYTGTGLYADSWGPTDVLASYQYSRSDGDFSFLDNNGTPANPTDDRRIRRRNNDYEKHSLVTRLGRRVSEVVTLSLYNNLFFEERGVPGLGTLTSDTAHLTTTRNLTQLDVQLTPTGRAGWQLKISPFFSVNKSQFVDLDSEIGLGQQNNDDDTFLYGTDLLFTLPWGSHQKWTVLTSYRGEQFRPENRAAAIRTGTASVRNRLTVAIENEIYLWNDRLILTPTLRTELIFNDLSANSAAQFPVSGKLSFSLQLPAGFALRGSGGRAYRVPNFLELFGDRGAIVGNPGLNAERSWNFDAGLLWTQRPYRLAMTYFENRLTNLIQFLQTSQLTARATNLAAATIRGFEFEAEAHPFTWLQLTSNYTFQWAKDTSGRAGFDGQFLPGRAQHQLNFSANFPIRWGRFYAALDFIDSNFLDSLNTLKVERRSLLSVGATARPWKWLTAGFEIKNLLSEKIEDVVGFPVPGRLFFGNLTVTI